MTWISLAAFAASFDPSAGVRPPWLLPHALAPLPEIPGLRGRLEDILDTVTVWQRAEWQHNGVYVGPTTLPTVYRDALYAARTLHVAVTPVIVCAVPAHSQGIHGTNGRAFVALSPVWLEGKSEAERRFILGRAAGHLAAHQVTTATLFALLADSDGVRASIRRLVGPALELALAPLGLATRVALARWHRTAELSADRAGLLVARDLEAAAMAMLTEQLGPRPKIQVGDYLAALRAAAPSPGRWAELLAAAPWTHKRIAALDLFTRSALWAECTGEPVEDPLSTEQLKLQTAALLGAG